MRTRGVTGARVLLCFETRNVPDVWSVRGLNFLVSSSIIFHLGGLSNPSSLSLCLTVCHLNELHVYSSNSCNFLQLD